MFDKRRGCCVRRSIYELILIVIELDNIWGRGEKFCSIQISIMSGLIREIEPVWFIWLVKRRLITRDRNVAFEEHPRHLSGKVGIHSHRCSIERGRKRFIVRPIKRSLGAISKDECSGDPRSGGKVVDALDDRIGSREFDEATAFKDEARGEIEEAIGSLYVARGAKTDCR